MNHETPPLFPNKDGRLIISSHLVRGESEDYLIYELEEFLNGTIYPRSFYAEKQNSD